MSVDVQILPLTEGEFNFSILGKAEDSDFMILQRVFTLLLSSDAAYRSSGASVALLNFLEGGNYPDDGIMTSILGLCCSDVLLKLDAEDRQRIASLSGEFMNNTIVCTLTFVDGAKLTGVING